MECSSGACPNPSRYPGEPLLCTAPIKVVYSSIQLLIYVHCCFLHETECVLASLLQYQYANYSANYMYWGKGSIRFRLINQRADFAFALFTGGLENVSSLRSLCT